MSRADVHCTMYESSTKYGCAVINPSNVPHSVGTTMMGSRHTGINVVRDSATAPTVAMAPALPSEVYKDKLRCKFM
jgi:hypothetical protein